MGLNKVDDSGVDGLLFVLYWVASGERVAGVIGTTFFFALEGRIALLHGIELTVELGMLLCEELLIIPPVHPPLILLLIKLSHLLQIHLTLIQPFPNPVK